MASDIGSRIREARLQKGVTLTQLAADLGIGKGYLSELERGIKSNPHLELVGQIASALDVPTGKLLLGSVDNARLDKSVRAMLEELKKERTPDENGFLTVEGIVCNVYGGGEGIFDDDESGSYYIAVWKRFRDGERHYHMHPDDMLRGLIGKRVRLTYKVEVLGDE